MINKNVDKFDSEYINCYSKIRGDRTSQIPIIIKKIKQYFKNPSIIDFGCGFGRIAIPLAKTFGHVHCIDYNKFAIKYLDKLSNTQNINISTEQFDFNNGNFNNIRKTDVCLLVHMIHWIDNTEVFFRNISNCLNQNGIIIISYYRKSDLDKMLLYRILGNEILQIQKKTTPTMTIIKQQLRSTGFKVKEIIYCTEDVNYKNKVAEIVNKKGLYALKLYKSLISENEYRQFTNRVSKKINSELLKNSELKGMEKRTMIIAQYK